MNEKLLKSVAEIQKEFIYEKFVAGDYTIYHCHKPGTSTYSFEIILGKMGIYVGGDIDSISYRVARGIEFLAGDDIDYYQHSKLEHVYYDKKVIDKSLVEKYLIDTLWGATEGLPYEDIPDDRPKTLEEIVAFYQKHGLDKDVWESRESKASPHNHAWDLYVNLNGCEDLQEVYQTIHDSTFYDGEMPAIDRADERVMFCLYMVHCAAKKILEAEKNE